MIGFEHALSWVSDREPSGAEHLRSTREWQTAYEDLRRQPLGRKPDRKRRQKSAEACRRLQVRETRETPKMPKKTGFLELRRLSQLGYGDLILTAFAAIPLGQRKYLPLADNCSRLLMLNSRIRHSTSKLHGIFRSARSSPGSTRIEGLVTHYVRKKQEPVHFHGLFGYGG